MWIFCIQNKIIVDKMHLLVYNLKWFLVCRGVLCPVAKKYVFLSAAVWTNCQTKAAMT